MFNTQLQVVLNSYVMYVCTTVLKLLYFVISAVRDETKIRLFRFGCGQNLTPTHWLPNFPSCLQGFLTQLLVTLGLFPRALLKATAAPGPSPFLPQPPLGAETSWGLGLKPRWATPYAISGQKQEELRSRSQSQCAEHFGSFPWKSWKIISVKLAHVCTYSLLLFCFSCPVWLTPSSVSSLPFVSVEGIYVTSQTPHKSVHTTKAVFRPLSLKSPRSSRFCLLLTWYHLRLDQPPSLSSTG